MEKNFLEIGKIVNIHALQGEVKAVPWCDSAEFLCAFDTLYKKDGTAMTVTAARVQKGAAILKFKGINTPEQAGALRGTILYMDRDDITLDEGTYFIQDLIGLSVVDADTGKVYGILDEVLQTGANDVYSIRNGEKTHLIPAIPDVIVETSLDQKRMLIRPLKGLFDDAD